MLSRFGAASTARAATMSATQARHFTKLNSEGHITRLIDKVQRANVDYHSIKHFRHPKYVMSREKALNTVWRDNGIFIMSLYVLVPAGVLYTTYHV